MRGHAVQEPRRLFAGPEAAVRAIALQDALTHSFKCSVLEIAREIDKPQRKRELPTAKSLYRNSGTKAQPDRDGRRCRAAARRAHRSGGTQSACHECHPPRRRLAIRRIGSRQQIRRRVWRPRHRFFARCRDPAQRRFPPPCSVGGISRNERPACQPPPIRHKN